MKNISVVIMFAACGVALGADNLRYDTAPGRPQLDTAAAGPPALEPAKVHDLVGAWSILKTSKSDGPVPRAGDVPLIPELEKKRAELERMQKAGENLPGRNSKCIPAGLPDMMVFNFNVWATAEYLIVHGGYGTLRPIWLNRTAHTPASKLFPSYQGESIGHWEGNTLVVDTIGLDPSNEITYALSLDDPDMHIIERWTLLDPKELKIVTTIESKKSLTKPYTYTNVYDRRPSSEIITPITYCDKPLLNGEMNLTPPTGGYIPPGADK
jgi:hypothetical protein